MPVTRADTGGVLGETRQAASDRSAAPDAPAAGGGSAPVARRPVRHVAEVTEVTQQALRLLADGDHARLHGLVRERTAQQLPADLLARTWARALAEVGQLEGSTTRRS